MSAEQGDVEVIRNALLWLRGGSRQSKSLDALDRLTAALQDEHEHWLGMRDCYDREVLARGKAEAALERAERERDDDDRPHLLPRRLLWERVRAAERERDEWRIEADRGKWPKEKAQEFFQWRARAEKAERALAEIEVSEPDWAKGVDENCETLRSIARAALRPSEKASDES